MKNRLTQLIVIMMAIALFAIFASATLTTPKLLSPGLITGKTTTNTTNTTNIISITGSIVDTLKSGECDMVGSKKVTFHQAANNQALIEVEGVQVTIPTGIGEQLVNGVRLKVVDLLDNVGVENDMVWLRIITEETVNRCSEEVKPIVCLSGLIGQGYQLQTGQCIQIEGNNKKLTFRQLSDNNLALIDVDGVQEIVSPNVLTWLNGLAIVVTDILNQAGTTNDFIILKLSNQTGILQETPTFIGPPVPIGARIAQVWSDKNYYNQGEPVTIYAKAVEQDGSPATFEEGFSAKFQIFDFNGQVIYEVQLAVAYNSANGYWEAKTAAPGINPVRVVVNLLNQKGELIDSNKEFYFEVEGVKTVIPEEQMPVGPPVAGEVAEVGGEVGVVVDKIEYFKRCIDKAIRETEEDDSINMEDEANNIPDCIGIKGQETYDSVILCITKILDNHPTIKQKALEICPGYFAEGGITTEVYGGVTLGGYGIDKFFCQGCKKDGKCLPYGTRLIEEDTPKYCGISSEFGPQAKEGEACQNSYECESNECGNGKCISTYGLLEKILNFLKQLLGIGE